jgi:hypothetical protein
MIKDVIRNAESAKKTWGEFTSKNPDRKFDRYFHLRPTSRRVTIVTTHETRPMRGVESAITELYDALCVVNDAISGDSVDWDTIKSKLRGKEFEIGGVGKEKNEENEFRLQARMINGMRGNAELKTKLGVGDLRFAASEMILREKDVKGGKKIDIVGHDGMGSVFFFELKTPGNMKDAPKAQVEKYLDRYGKGGFGNEAFENLMKTYPMYSIPSLEKYFSYAVVGYGEKIKNFISADGKNAGRIEME